MKKHLFDHILEHQILIIFGYTKTGTTVDFNRSGLIRLNLVK